MNRKILTSVLLSCFLANGQLQVNAATKAQEDQVWHLSGKQKLPEAIHACNLILAKEPDNYVALLNRGLCIVWSGDLRRGHKELIRTMRLHKQRPEVRDHLTNTYLMLGNPQAALVQAEQLHKLEPTGARGYLAKTRVLLKLKRYEEALSCVQLAVRDPKVDARESLTAKISALVMLRRYSEAEAELKRAKPGQIHWWQIDGIANQAAADGKFDEIIFIESHSPNKLTSEGPLYLLTYSHANLGHRKEAEAYMKLLEKFNPSHQAARFALAHMYQPEEFPKIVLGHLSFIQPAVRDADYWDMSYRCHMKLQSYDEAAKDLSGSLALQKVDLDQVDTYTKRGNLYFMLSQTRKAIADYTSAIKLSPFDRQLYKERSEAYEDLGDTAHARADLLKFEALSNLRPK